MPDRTHETGDRDARPSFRPQKLHNPVDVAERRVAGGRRHSVKDRRVARSGVQAGRCGRASGPRRSFGASGRWRCRCRRCSGPASFTETAPRPRPADPGEFDRAPAQAAPPRSRPIWAQDLRLGRADRLADVTAHGNLDVAAAAARILQADAQTAISASLFSIRNSRARNAPPGPSPRARRGRNAGRFTHHRRQQFQLGLTASYELDLWGRTGSPGLASAKTPSRRRFARDAAGAVVGRLDGQCLSNAPVGAGPAEDRRRQPQGAPGSASKPSRAASRSAP